MKKLFKTFLAVAMLAVGGFNVHSAMDNSSAASELNIAGVENVADGEGGFLGWWFGTYWRNAAGSVVGDYAVISYACDYGGDRTECEPNEIKHETYYRGTIKEEQVRAWENHWFSETTWSTVYEKQY